MKDLLRFTKEYRKRLEEEDEKSQEQIEVENVGKLDPKRHLESNVDDLLTSNINQTLGTMLQVVVF